MSFLKEYIEDNIDLDIKEFVYINMDSENFVHEYEITDKITVLSSLGLKNVNLVDFLNTYKDFIGVYSSSMTFTTKSHDMFDHPQIFNCGFNGMDYCYVTVKDNIIEFLVNNIPAYKDILYIDISQLTEFNSPNKGFILDKVSMLDEFFISDEVIRLYKKYNEYYIFC